MNSTFNSRIELLFRRARHEWESGNFDAAIKLTEEIQKI
jgi:hypothetical protein